MTSRFSRRKLKNRIIVLFEKRRTPVVSLSITNRYGGGHDSAEIKGSAHFIEHLLFTGTKTRSHEDISREIEKKGGMLNAGTYNEMTSYLFKLPSEHLFTGLEILTDMLNNTEFLPEKFEKEKKVIFEEIKMNHDAPQRHIWTMTEENLFAGAFGKSSLGTTTTLKSLKREFIINYFNKLYSPSNFIVSVVGNANLNKICNYLEKNFKGKKAKIPKLKIRKINKKTTEKREDIDQAHFVWAVHAPKPLTKDFATLCVLDAYFASGMSSQLFLEIREKRGLAYAVKSTINSEKNSPYYAIYVGTKKEALKEVEKIILEELKRIEKMTLKNLKEAKQQLIGNKHISSEESLSVMEELLVAELATGNAGDYYDFEKKIKSVTLNDVKSFAKSLIKNYSTASIVPK